MKTPLQRVKRIVIDDLKNSYETTVSVIDLEDVARISKVTSLEGYDPMNEVINIEFMCSPSILVDSEMDVLHKTWIWARQFRWKNNITFTRN